MKLFDAGVDGVYFRLLTQALGHGNTAVVCYSTLRKTPKNSRRVSRGVLETEHCLQKTEKERKVAVGPGYKRGSAGHETSNCGEMRVRW